MIKMSKLIHLGKKAFMYLYFYEIYRCICAGNDQGASTSTDPSKTDKKDPFKTTFEGDLINLDVNCKHGYNSKFRCTVEYTKVVYQSNCFFKKVSDGDLKIWEASDKNAFRVTLQFLDFLPLTAYIETERGDDDKSSFYLRKYGSQEWEECDKNTHDARVTQFHDALKEYKDSIKKLNDEAIDLCLTIKNDGYTFEVHHYKDDEKKVSSKTPSGKKNNSNTQEHRIDVSQYTVTDKMKEARTGVGQSREGQATPEVDSLTSLENSSDDNMLGVENPQRHLVFEMKDKYRIVKFRYNQGALIPTLDVWETGGTYYVVKIVAVGDSDRYTKFMLEIVDSESGKRLREYYEFQKNNFLTKNTFEYKETKPLLTFDFKY